MPAIPTTAEPRPVHFFKVPKGIGGVLRVGLVELTTGEQLEAAARARGDSVRLQFELAKQCLVQVNEEKLSLGDMTLDKKWGSLHPKVVNLIAAGYQSLHVPEEEEAAAFLASREDTVG